MHSRDGLISLYKRVYRHPRLVFTLKLIGAVSVSLVVLLFAYALGVLVFFGEYVSALKLTVLTAVPFLAVTALRTLINCERPYEVFDIAELSDLRSGARHGHSFPSRHVFSAFCVSALSAAVSPWLSLAAAVAGTALSVSRVLLGIHFIRDVLAGALIGIVSGLLGLAIIVF